MKTLNLMSMDLQFFAADTGSEGAQAETNPSEVEFSPDNLTEEQLATIKEKFGFKTDDDVDSIVKSKHSRWQKELDAQKAEAEKLAKMNADEKAEHERKQLEAKIAELEQRETQRGLAKEAGKMLTANKLRADDTLVNLLVREDADKTKVAVNDFVEYMKEEKRQWEIERNTGTTPKRTINNQNTVTQEQFDAMPYAQKSALASSNPELFKKLTGGY